MFQKEIAYASRKLRQGEEDYVTGIEVTRLANGYEVKFHFNKKHPFNTLTVNRRVTPTSENVKCDYN